MTFVSIVDLVHVYRMPFTACLSLASFSRPPGGDIPPLWSPCEGGLTPVGARVNTTRYKHYTKYYTNGVDYIQSVGKKIAGRQSSVWEAPLHIIKRTYKHSNDARATAWNSDEISQLPYTSKGVLDVNLLAILSHPVSHGWGRTRPALDSNLNHLKTATWCSIRRSLAPRHGNVLSQCWNPAARAAQLQVFCKAACCGQESRVVRTAVPKSDDTDRQPTVDGITVWGYMYDIYLF